MSTPKSKSIEDLITNITGISRQSAKNDQICVWCKKPITPFKDIYPHVNIKSLAYVNAAKTKPSSKLLN